jgi:hypothetical protein
VENTAVNLSPFVTPLQIRDGAEYLFQPLDSYRRRINETIGKIDSLVDILPATQLSESEYDQWSRDRSIAIEIRNTIGIYFITSKTYAQESSIVYGSKILWYKKNGNTQPEIDPFINGVWKDWLGDKGITELGGYVVVSLSDTGVEYLNGIADRVASLTKELGNPKTSQYLSPNG